jgi:DNA replication and repair protein RecF
MITAVLGNNAAGKTSIVEGLALLSTGESFRAERDEDMIAFGEELARLKTKLEVAGEGDELEVVLTRGILQGKAVQRKHYFVNGTRRRKKDFLGHFTTVVFRPEDMRLVEGSPSRRRQFVDTILSVVHPEYGVSLTTYENALKRRNKLIDQVQQQLMPRTVLNYWTQLMLKHGSLVQEYRRKFFAEFAESAFPIQFKVVYDPSVVSEERFALYAEKEIAAGHTLIGPHKDDFFVHFVSADDLTPDWHDVAQFGSRGQQRLAVLWLKWNELQYVERTMGQRPLLLLDDILSELDRDHRQQVEDLLKIGQSVITTTEPAVVEDLQSKFPNLQVLKL